MERRVVPAESPFVATVGYSRAVRVGPHVHVSGTAPIMPGEGEPPVDPYEQAKRCLEIVVAALAEVGARPEDVVRTRAYLTEADDWKDVGRAHGEVFGDIRPTLSLVHVLPFLDPKMLVEIELVAQKSAS